MELDYILKMLKKYVEIDSPGGYTSFAISECEKDFNDLGVKTKLTKKGGLIATIKGENDDEHHVISAHIDTLGGMVKEITQNGKIKYHKIGGGTYNSVEGENCTIITNDEKKIRGSIMPIKSSTHIHGLDVTKNERNKDNMIIRIDEKVENKQDVYNLGINIGDFVAIDTRLEITKSGFIKSRYIDDKIAIAIVFDLIRTIKENKIKLKNTTHFYLSNYEEMGHGVSNIFSSILKDKVCEFIAIDIATVGEGQASSEYEVTICAKDGRTVYDFDLRKKLINIAKENNIKYNIDVFNNYGSDASQAILAGADFKFACVGIGVDGSHHYERTHIESVKNTVELLLNYIS